VNKKPTTNPDLEMMKGSAMPPEIQGQIGKQLREVYGKLLAEPLPDKFIELLNQLSKPERKA